MLLKAVGKPKAAEFCANFAHFLPAGTGLLLKLAICLVKKKHYLAKKWFASSFSFLMDRIFNNQKGQSLSAFFVFLFTCGIFIIHVPCEFHFVIFHPTTIICIYDADILHSC